ncbi:UNVERIFIED_CONTAM: hypothetical protein FKN15_026460, partial [Acipenser sinensis]
GLYHFNVMPFGLKNAPSTFQRLMELVLRDVQRKICFVYLDDIIIYSPNAKQHLEDVQAILERLRIGGLTVNLKKCQLGCAKLAFLGHIVSGAGIQVDPSKTEAIQHFPQPTCLKGLQRFLGMAGWYHRFVPNFSVIAAPLNALKKKGVRWNWSEECQLAFEQLKQHLVTPPVLGHPNFEYPFVVYTDASGIGLGAVLVQRRTQTEEEVLAFASRALTAPERNYSTTELECLAVVWAIERWRYYLESRTFTIVTDHSSLLWVFNTVKPNTRLIRWVLRLQEFNFTVEYRRGKLNEVPDALSRAPVSPSVNVLLSVQASRKGESESFHPFPISDVDLWEAQKRDPECQKIYQRLLTEVEETKNLAEPVVSYTILEDKVYRKVITLHSGTRYQIYVPQDFRKEILQAYHDNPLGGHFGRYKTLNKILTCAYWPGVWKDVNVHVRQCPVCQVFKPENRKPVGKLQHVDSKKPWELIGVDLVGPLPTSSMNNTQLLKEILQAYHDNPLGGHFGRYKTLNKILTYQSQRGSLFTLFLYNPLMAFLYVCGLSSMRSGLWDKCQEFLRKVNRDLGQLISRSRSTDIEWVCDLAFLTDMSKHLSDLVTKTARVGCVRPEKEYKQRQTDGGDD